MIHLNKFKSWYLSFIYLSLILVVTETHAADKSSFQPESTISLTPGNNSLTLTQTVTNDPLHYRLKIPADWLYKTGNQDLQIADAEKNPMIFIVAVDDQPPGTRQKLDDLFNKYSPEKANFIQELFSGAAPSYKLINQGMLTNPTTHGSSKGYFFIMGATMNNHNIEFANIIVQRTSEPRYLMFTFFYRLDQKPPQNLDTELAIFQSWTF